MAKTENRQWLNDPERLAEGLLHGRYTYDPGTKSIVGAGAYTLKSWRDDFYLWKDGAWSQVSDAEMKRVVADHLHGLNEELPELDTERIGITTHRVANIVLCLKGIIGIPEAVEVNSWPDGRESLYNTISFNNGLLLIRRNGTETPALTDHTPNFFNAVKLPFKYDPDAKCPKWLKFLDEVMQSRQERILLLQQWCGYLFRPDLQEQKFLLCVGEGANGKGVFFEVVQALVGEDNCSQVSLTRFNNPFAPYSTLGKALNATNESSHIIEDEAENVLKSLVAGDRFTFERKFRDPVHAVPTAKIQIATNALPRFSDKTMGVWRRILLIPFDKVFPDELQIKDLAKQLKKELPGILNWALEGLQKLNDAGGFAVPQQSEELLEEYRRDADPARAFLLENYQTSFNGQGIACSELYGSYKNWCEQNGCHYMGERQFGRHVKRIFPNVTKARPGTGTNRVRLYQGITSNQNEQVQDEIPF